MAGNDGVWSETSLPLHPAEKRKLKTRRREGESVRGCLWKERVI